MSQPKINSDTKFTSTEMVYLCWSGLPLILSIRCPPSEWQAGGCDGENRNSARGGGGWFRFESEILHLNHSLPEEHFNAEKYHTFLCFRFITHDPKLTKPLCLFYDRYTRHRQNLLHGDDTVEYIHTVCP